MYQMTHQRMSVDLKWQKKSDVNRPLEPKSEVTQQELVLAS